MLGFFQIFCRRVCLVIIFLFVTEAKAALTHDPQLTWKSLHSEHFIVHFHDNEEALARKTVAIAERVHQRLAPFFSWTPGEPTEIVLSDRSDVVNGYATPIPTNRMVLFVTPPEGITALSDYDSWLDMLITHEYTHILHVDKATGAAGWMRQVFGRFPLLFPNIYQPTWLIEGLAAHAETDPQRAIGRGQNSFFEMMIRMEVENGIKPLKQINQPVKTWPGSATPYLYGVNFYNFLSNRFGPEVIPRLVNNYSNNLIPFRINSNSAQVMHRDLAQLWAEFEQYLRAKYQPQLAAIVESGIHEGKQITQHGYNTGMSRAHADGTLFYIKADGRSEPSLMKHLPGQTPRKLRDVDSSAQFDIHPQAGIVLAQPEICRNTSYFYDLYRIDPKSGDARRLTRCERLRSPVWSPAGDRIAAVTGNLGQTSINLLDAQGRHLEVLWKFVADEVVSELAWGPDQHTLFAAIYKPKSGWNLEMLSLQDKRWTLLISDAAIKGQPTVSADGKYVYFSADYGGVFNIRRLNLLSKQIETVTNVAGGAFWPTLAGNQLYYTGYKAAGFDIFAAPLKVQAVPAQLSAQVHNYQQDPAPEQRADIYDYSPWAGLRPRWWFPWLAIDQNRAEIGAATSGSDALNRHQYAVAAAYDVTNGYFLGSFDYVYDRWYPILKIHASRTNDFTLNGDFEKTRVRRAETYQAEIILPLISRRSRWALHTAILQDLEADEWRAAGELPYPDSQDGIVGLALTFNSTRNYPLSISRSYGREVRLVLENSDALASDYSGDVYSLDWREFIALPGEHVLSGRFVAGWGTDVPRPFNLGGVAPAEVLPELGGSVLSNPFNTRDYALRGYPDSLSGLLGRRMILSSLEWRFPIKRIERGVTVPPVALNQIYGSVFIDSGSVWNLGDQPQEYFTGIGAEAHIDTYLFYSIPIEFRVGIAHGLNEGGEDQFYLTAGTSY